MEQAEKVDEAFRRLNAGEAAVQPVAPSVAEAAGRMSSVRINVRSWVEVALQRLQSSDLAMTVHATSSGGGGRIGAVAALIGVCVSGVGAGTYCVATALLPDPKPAIRAEAKPASKPKKAAKAKRDAELSRLPSPASQAVAPTPTPARRSRPDAADDATEAPEPRASPDLTRSGEHPGLLVRAAVRRSRTGHAGGCTIDRRRGVRTMIRRLFLIAVLATVGFAADASAGVYSVRACWDGEGVNHAWRHAASSTTVESFTQCPAGPQYGASNAGMTARNSLGPSLASPFAYAETYFDAPPGTRIVRVWGDFNLISQQAWAAGLVDAATNSWRLCGTTCLSTFGWQPFDVPFSTSRVAARTICGRGEGCSRSVRNGSVSLRNVQVVLQEDGAPSVSIAGGSLVSGGWRRGVQDVGGERVRPSRDRLGRGPNRRSRVDRQTSGVTSRSRSHAPLADQDPG